MTMDDDDEVARIDDSEAETIVLEAEPISEDTLRTTVDEAVSEGPLEMCDPHTIEVEETSDENTDVVVDEWATQPLECQKLIDEITLPLTRQSTYQNSDSWC